MRHNNGKKDPIVKATESITTKGYIAMRPRQVLIGILLSLLLGLGALWATIPEVIAAPGQAPIETRRVHLGNASGDLVFEPNQLTFIAGKPYRLQLDNPSPTKHYFTAKDFADAIWTRKVDAGNVEVKGAIHELELRPGAVAEWVFVPEKSGRYELRCSIPGHADSGMVGQLTITGPKRVWENAGKAARLQSGDVARESPKRVKADNRIRQLSL